MATGIDVQTPLPPPASAVAITALGAVTASGASVSELFTDMLSGRRPFTAEKIPLVATALAGEKDEGEVYGAHVRCPLDVSEVVGDRAARTFSRDSRLLLHTVHTAGARPVPEPDRTGVVLGTLRAGRNEYLAIHNASRGDGGPVNPVWGPQSGYNAPAAQLSIHLPARGPNLTLASGATAGLDAMVLGARQVSTGTCDAVVAGGVDILSPAVAGLPGSEDVPEGEAAAAVVLRRPAPDGPVLGHLLGSGQATALPDDPALGATSAPAAAAEAAVREALRTAGRLPSEVGLGLVACGGDREAEEAGTAALAAVFGDELPSCCPTRTAGRTGGADGALAFAVALEALRREAVPLAPVERRSPDGGVPRPAGPLAVCLSADPGGHATAVLLQGRSGEAA